MIIIIRTVLVDDEYNSLQRLKEMVKTNSDLEIIALYQDSEQLLEEIDSYLNQLDLLFLDIEMPGIKGLELAEIILSKNEEIEIIFVTAYNEYAVEAFEINALDYLLKPIPKKRFKKTVSRVTETIAEDNTEDNLEDNKDATKKDTKNDTKKEKNKLKVYTFARSNFKDNSNQKLNISWPTAKVEELFYYLLSHEGDFTAKDKIIDQLWPQSVVERARDILYTTIYNLRKTFKEAGFTKIVLSKRGYYRLNLENLEVDTVRFKNLIKDYEQGELKAEEVFKQLQTVYQGDYLAKKSYNWINTYRTHLKNEYLNILKKLNEDFREKNKTKLLKKSLKTLTELDPLAEQSFKELIKIYKKEGNKVKAERCYKRLKDNLWQELQITPDFNLDNG